MKGIGSSVRFVNKRPTAVEVHWVRSPATETAVMSTKKMGEVQPGGPDYRATSKIGDRFVVYEKADPQVTICEVETTMKPSVFFLHEDEEEQVSLSLSLSLCRFLSVSLSLCLSVSVSLPVSLPVCLALSLTAVPFRRVWAARTFWRRRVA